MPTDYETTKAFGRLQSEWVTPTQLTDLRPVPPSRELFNEAVQRANRDHYVPSESVATSLMAGRWPERRT